MRAERVAAILVSVAFLGAAVGCGTTVPLAAQSAGPGNNGLSATQGGSAPLPAAPGASTTGSSSGTVGSLSTGTAAAPGGTSGDSSIGPGQSLGGNTPQSGVEPGSRSNKPLLVGVITSGNAAAFASSIGLNKNFGDQRLQAQAVADYLNHRGGVLGHPLKLTFYDYNATATGPANAATACSAFTDDNHAFATIGIAGMDDAFHACAYKHGMLVLSDGDLKSSRFFRKFPTTIEISDMALDRKYRGVVLALKQEGFFTPGAKVGILSTDDPNDIDGVQQGMKPALASIGITNTTDITVSSGDSSQQASGTQSAVLKFRAAGVTHILFGHASAFIFAEDAQSQSYFPKMGVDSRQSPALLMQGADSPQQLVNTVGIGYQPVQDVDAAHDPGPVSSNQVLCKKIYDEAGQGWGTNRLAMASALYLCEQLLYLHDALQAQPTTSTANFLNGVAALGTQFKSTLTFATRFSAQQHDGAQAYRPLRYDTGCSCFKYSGPIRPFP